MGQQYAQPSAMVMKILLLSVVFSSANSTSGGVAYGMEKLKRVMVWAVAEAAANLTLSIILVHKIGIYGVAWGTAIPSVVIEMLLWPRYVCRLVVMPVRVYLWQTWFRTTLAIVPFTVACAITERFWPVHNLAIFFLQIAALLPLVPLAVTVVFREEVMTQVRAWKRRRNGSDRNSNEYESSTTTVG
jgi:O-antigen/teichoic acid export membrane protein